MQINRVIKMGIAVGIVLCLAILGSIIHHFQLKAAVNRYKAELQAQGEPLELRQVLPPPVPVELNQAADYQQAVSLLSSNQNVLFSNPPPVMRMVAPGKALVGWRQPWLLDGRMSNSWDDVQAALAEDKRALALLGKLPRQPIFDFQLNYTNSPEKMRFPHLAVSKKAALRLGADAQFSLHQGDPDSAGKDIQTMLSLVQGLAHDRIVITELVRIALAHITTVATWEYLQATNLTDPQLAALQVAWIGLDFSQSTKQAFLLERAGSPVTLDEWRSSNLPLLEYFEIWDNLGLPNHDARRLTGWDRIKLHTKIFSWRYWWSYSDELTELQGYQVFLQSLRQAETNAALLPLWQKQNLELAKLVPTSTPVFTFARPEKVNFHQILASELPPMGRCFAKVMSAETAKQITLTAIALKRCQLRHGDYPDTLAGLVPEFLAAVPRDPLDGQPLRYRRNANGTFTLYSIGENGVDDGGNPTLKPGASAASLAWQHADALDWVWPQPATAAEVENYYARQSK